MSAGIIIKKTTTPNIRVSQPEPRNIQVTPSLSGGVQLMPTVELKEGNVLFHYVTLEQMENIHIRVEGTDTGTLGFTLIKGEDSFELRFSADSPQSFAGQLVYDDSIDIVDYIFGDLSVQIPAGYNVPCVHIDGVDANMLEADINWRIADLQRGQTTTAKEATLEAVGLDAAAAKTAAQGITGYALQGNDPTATNTAILQAMPTIPTDYAKAGSGTNVTNTDLKNLLNGISTAMYKGVPVVTQSGNATIAPNTWNVWTSVAGNLTIKKGTDIDNITNCYIARFTLASNWSGQIVFSGFSLDWNGGSVPTWTAGKTYEVNIVDNIAMWAEITPAS